MDTKAIEYVSAIIREGNVSRAAETLFISQPALSQYVAKLENDLGVALFSRDGKRLTLTRAGEIFMRDGADMLSLYSRMLGRMRDATKLETETIRLGISQFYSKYYLPQVLPSFMREHPNVEFAITEALTSSLEEMTEYGKLDLSMIPLYMQRSGLEYAAIHNDEIYLAVPGDSSSNNKASYVDGIASMRLIHVKNEPFIMLKPVHQFAQMAERLCEEAGFVPNIVCQVLSWDTLNLLVGAGLGVGFVPDITIGSVPPDRAPRYYRISSELNIIRPYCIANSTRHELSDMAKLFREHVVGTLMGDSTAFHPMRYAWDAQA